MRALRNASIERKLMLLTVVTSSLTLLLGASAAAPPHMWKEQGQRRALCAILPWTPWVVVTVPALVPCARL